MSGAEAVDPRADDDDVVMFGCCCCCWRHRGALEMLKVEEGPALLCLWLGDHNGCRGEVANGIPGGARRVMCYALCGKMGIVCLESEVYRAA